MHTSTLQALLVLCSCLLFPGCGEPSPPVGTHEYFNFVESGASAARRRDIGDQLFRLTTETAVPGDVITCVETPSMAPICSFVVPDASGVARITDRTVALEIAKLQAFLTSASAGSSHQLGLPAVASTVLRLRRTDLPPRVLLCASPIYDDARHPAWTFANGRAALPRALTSEGSPFAEGCESFPDRAVVIWLLPPASEDGCIDQPHRKGVFDFNRAFIEHYNGKLHRTTDNVAAAFDFDGPSPITEKLVSVDDARSIKMFAMETVPTATPLKARSYKLGPVRSKEEVTPTPLPADNSPAATIDVEDVLKAAATNKQQIAMAINWTSTTPDCDIDLRISSAGHADELNFTRKDTAFGKLMRDVVKSGSIEGDGGDYEQWECATINHDRLRDLTVWLNVFRTRGPATVRFICVWKGQRSEMRIELPANFDLAYYSDWRRWSSAWHSIDLAALPFTASPAGGNVVAR